MLLVWRVPPRTLPALPIDSVLAELVDAMATHACVVLEAPPGAGKTTRVPPRILDHTAPDKEVWVAEPRRLAAKLMAHRVATELGRAPGTLVGYTVRFEECASSETRLRYVTSGILLRRLLSDPELKNIDCVVLDEFHERHADTDLALTLLRRVQERRPDLRLVVMSATLDGARIARFLGDCPRITSAGRLFPIEVEFEAPGDDRPLEKRVVSALRRILSADASASTLVFLPGAAEIRRTHTAIEELCQRAGVDVLTLHGDLPLDAQTRAIQPGQRPRVVLTTNVAESSITVEGINAVIDSGLCRQMGSAGPSGIPRLTVEKISRASATQRAGRAGRMAPGRVIRLFTKGDFETRPEFEVPEIVRVDFAEALLLLSGAARTYRSSSTAPTAERAPDARARSSSFDWRLLDAPAEASIELSRGLLRQLGALDASDELTGIGARMLELPLHPRLARLLVECDSRGIGQLGSLAVALLSERDLRSQRQSGPGGRTDLSRHVFSADSDVVELIDTYVDARDARMNATQLRAAGIDPGAFFSVQRTHDQLRRFVGRRNREAMPDTAAERELAMALLVAFPDRIAKRRSADSSDLVLRTGATARLAENSVVTHASWMIAVEVEVRRDSARSSSVVRLASAIEENWLLDVLGDELVDDEEYSWVEPPGRVELRSRIRIGSIIVDETRRAAKPGPESAAVLLGRAEALGILQSAEVARLFARLALVAAAQPGASEFDADAFRTRALSEVFRSRIDLAGLDGPTLATILASSLPGEIANLLRSEVPEYVQLPKGRRCLIHYESGKPPFIASRLQDFFGQPETPTILRGRQRLVVHLLAPNQRAVQITDDLRGFWRVHYPDLRRQLMRRYPRHSWPEDGLAASPPDPRPRPGKA